MRDVVGEREENEHDGKAHGQWRAVLEQSPEAKQAQNEHRCLNKDIGRIEGLILQISAIKAPVSRPHVDDATAGHPNEPARMAANVGFRLQKLVIHVGDFAYSFVFSKFLITVVGMQVAVDPALRISVIADVQLKAEAVTHGDEPVE